MTLPTALLALADTIAKASPGPWERDGGWGCVRDDQNHIVVKLDLNHPANLDMFVAARESEPLLREAAERIRALALALEKLENAIRNDRWIGPENQKRTLLEYIDKARETK